MNMHDTASLDGIRAPQTLENLGVYGLGTRNVGEAETASLWPSHWLTSKERGQGGRFIGMVVISEEFISLCT